MRVFFDSDGNDFDFFYVFLSNFRLFVFRSDYFFSATSLRHWPLTFLPVHLTIVSRFLSMRLRSYFDFPIDKPDTIDETLLQRNIRPGTFVHSQTPKRKKKQIKSTR